MKLAGKVAVITGGNSGIGFATAKLFQQEGAKVIITGKRRDAVEKAVQEIGGDAKGYTSNSSDLKDIASLYESIKNEYGKIDVLFVNAGIATFSPIEAVTEESYDSMMNTNLKGLYFNVQKALPLLSSGSSVIFNTSAADQKGFPNTSVYSATKAGVRSLARTLSAELLEKGIRVNSIAPGPIDTPVFEKLGLPEEAIPEVKKQFIASVPMKRIGSSEEVAKGVLFLASDDSSYVVGIDLSVDGGMAKL